MNKSIKNCMGFLLLGVLTHNTLLQAQKPDSLALIGAKSLAAGVSLTAMAGSLLNGILVAEVLCGGGCKDNNLAPNLLEARLHLNANPENRNRLDLGRVLLSLYGTLASGYLTYKFGKSAYKSCLTRRDICNCQR